MPWRWHWEAAVDQRSSTPIKAANSLLVTSLPGCRLQAEAIKISWSGRRRCYDNILIERLWRTVKYEEVYLRAYSDGWEAEISLARFMWRYCHVRPHSSL